MKITCKFYLQLNYQRPHIRDCIVVLLHQLICGKEINLYYVLVGQCLMLNSSEQFPYATIYSQVSSCLNLYFFELLCTQTHKCTDRHIDRDEYSTVAVDKPQL